MHDIATLSDENEPCTATATCTKFLVKFVRVDFELGKQTDKQADVLTTVYFAPLLRAE